MEKIKNILKELNEFGISKSNINDILNPNEIEFYNQLEVFYNNSLKDQNIKQKINEISNGNVDSNGKQKSYEITHDVYLKSPLNIFLKITAILMKNSGTSFTKKLIYNL